MVKVFVLGIDGAFPEFVFGKWLDELPNIKKLMDNGTYAKLNSTVPPLSVTAWNSILTGKSPVNTGLFEYVQRKNFESYDFNVITSLNLKEKQIWRVASDQGKKSIVCYALLTWPTKKFDGWMISDSLLGPSKDNLKSVYPPELQEELEREIGEVPPLDVADFRNFDKQQTIDEVYKLTSKHVEAMKYLIKNKDWDFFFGLLPLSDRMNHTFWKYIDPGHREYDPESEFKDTLKDFYKFVDGKLGELLELLDEDTKTIVLSDHGIQRMHTRINLTDWLIDNDYMVLKEPINGKTGFNFDMVDWSKTKAFAIGAYEGQIFINLKGKESQGIVEEEDYDSLVDELCEKMDEIKGDDGSELKNSFFKKKNCFKGKYEKEAPDIIVYFDGMQYGCNNSIVGNETQWNPITKRGIDDATHSLQGIFIMNNGYAKGYINEISYLDVAPTVLNELGIDIPEDMEGEIIG
ncbi:MAG TPA: alkaline phosphatase family protein [Candidatus Pacearchaeota archaeon]|jgi:predicted AlkP superfamily phosphohydrolase/phosphomutase|nr:alkaline phosphatase family protein [Candidatus Pacearchaeota archaeon]